MSIPPVLCSIEVPLAPEAAFDLFALRLDDWWPLQSNSLGLDHAVACTLEPEVGGRIYERTAEGLESLWGRVMIWDPPRRLMFTWHPGRHETTAQQVQVRFTAQGRGTRVTLEHGAWENAGERGPRLRGRYEAGWPGVLAHFKAKASGAVTAGTPLAAPFHG